MSYKVLYRKYRPSSFNTIVGQDDIINTLKSSVENNTFSHAYIFTGPRGTGKTSTAKVFAKTLNCECLKNGEACGTCESCINFENSQDIIEIDAASNNGVDEIREIRSNSILVPSNSKYKIYIIDEVHMLTTGAFNALLKTLEEPPAHIIFILATTEIYKVPITILSRCQRFDFKKIDKLTMKKHLKNIAAKENITIEDNAYELIYELSEGCMRDALSLVDQASKTSSMLTEESLSKEYDIISSKLVIEWLKNIKDGNINHFINEYNKLVDNGINRQKLIKKIINTLEEVVINIKLGKYDAYSFEDIYNLIKDLNDIYVSARINDNVDVLVKLAFIKLNKAAINYNDDATKVTNIKEEKISTSAVSVEKSDIKYNDVSIGDTKSIRVNNCFCEANKVELSNINKIWNNLNIILNGINVNTFNVVMASDKYVVLENYDESLVNVVNLKCELFEQELKKNNINQKIVALSTEQWNEEKKIYIKNIKNDVKYIMIDEPIRKSVDDNSMANDLFDSSLVEIS